MFAHALLFKGRHWSLTAGRVCLGGRGYDLPRQGYPKADCHGRGDRGHSQEPQMVGAQRASRKKPDMGTKTHLHLLVVFPGNT
jgi:hypothetical protein